MRSVKTLGRGNQCRSHYTPTITTATTLITTTNTTNTTNTTATTATKSLYQDLCQTQSVPFSSHKNLKSSMTLRLSLWNCRSLSLEKLQYLLSHNCEVNLLQEVWHPNETLQNLIPSTSIAKFRSIGEGGGTLMLLKNFPFKCHRCIAINQDCNLYRILLGRDKILWIGSIYLSMGTPAQIKVLFKNIYEYIPPNEWKFLILGGDFNVSLNYDLPKKKLLETLVRQFSLQITFSNNPTTQYGKPDYLIHGSAIKAEVASSNYSPSDHKCLIYNIEIPCPETHPIARIPNRKLAEKITLTAWNLANNSKEFLKINEICRRASLNKTSITIKRKVFKKPILQRILEENEDCDAQAIIRKYFEQFNKELEDQRFSNLSRKFFDYLKKVFKYDLLDKRDGSIISSLKSENPDEIITNPHEVNRRIMLTINELQVDLSKPRPKNLQFPVLQKLDVKEAKIILSKISTGKALTWDGLSDSIFKKSWIEKSSKIFADILQNLNSIPDHHFESRLIPLNKIHPNTPSRKDLRPIIVTSPLIKIIEACLLPDLTSYLIEKSHHSQTGFVPGNGIFVNIFRALERIKLRTSNRKRCYGIFIDFSSAYNTVDHQILFQKLLPILGEEKTNLIKSLYSRMKIRIGDETALPNQGVAQGSLISPALFNIYSEGLFKTIESEIKINEEDLLGYADDILIICDDLNTVSRVINEIRKWSILHNMKLNEKKSGIVEFFGRHMRSSLSTNDICGFPICKEYKYLGLRLTNKLSMGSQLSYIKTKSIDIQRRLSPFLHKADLDTKKNLWQVFIQPLIEFILPLYKFETAKTNILKANSTIRSSFKLFMGLCRSTSNEIVDILSGYNFEQRANILYEISKIKWISRKNGRVLNYNELPSNIKKFLNKHKKNVCRSMPHEIVEYLNITKSSCVVCNTPNSFQHLNLGHNCTVPNFSELLRISQNIQELQKPRKEKLETIRHLVKFYLEKIKFTIAKQKSIFFQPHLF